ncbi:MAG TPA: helix-turn-helix transcriptional regulator [Armatimonadetes bacterium]|nr:helix-turn-helix transcriptional regulator [Armatimonadota bacterium]
MAREVAQYPRTRLTRGIDAQDALRRADEVESLAQRLSALSDGNRLKILHLLHTCGEMCVCELQDVLGLTAPNLSFHLKILRYTGFVRARKQGKWVFYRAVSEQARGTGDAVRALFQGDPPQVSDSACAPCGTGEEE